ncbi:MAG: FAD-binding oxidoreductase [Chloroflexi bacterium]|nr:FAD-binding oxidoreductase [Chloroflexota bacterium]
MPSVPDHVLAGLRSSAAGDVLLPDDPGYDAARRVFNHQVDRRPALILRSGDTGDVVRGVDLARNYGLPLSVRGGGHSVAGTAVCDDGLMLDLSRLKGVDVDPVRGLAEAQPGLTLGELDAATAAFGLATPLGVVSMTGIAGLTLGGGLGWLNGRYGLACDNVRAAEVVTADGSVLTASPLEHADLYWAIRGGGGNFGVVTSFTYELHPVDVVLAGSLTYSPAMTREAMRFFQAFAGDPSSCPDELSLVGALGLDGDGQPVFSATACYCGDPDVGEGVLRPLRRFGPPIADTVELQPFTVLQAASDAGFPGGRYQYWKSSYLTNLTDAAIEVMLDFAARNPTPATSGASLQQMHGAASRVASDATAFAHRRPQYDFLILAQSADAALADANRAWARAFFEAMQPVLQESVYVNNLGEDGAERVRAAYGSNYARLAEVKGRYDPDNLFRLNHNVRPAAAGGVPR